MTTPAADPATDRALASRRRSGRNLLIAMAAIGVLLLAGRVFRGADSHPGAALPDFSAYRDTTEKKSAFFAFLAPHIAAVNAAVLRERRHLEAIRAEFVAGRPPGWLDRRWLARTAERYDCAMPERVDLRFLDLMLRRVDVIPPSLILAQAANESAWGTSRFARHGNNLFGMRTYAAGTGMVPKRRAAGAAWEVATYASVRDSIAAYVHNLNTHATYQRLRRIRRDLRRENRPVAGTALAAGLTRYSEKGHEYVALIRALIRGNDLAAYDGTPRAAARAD